MSLKSSISQLENSTKKLATNNNSPKSTKAVSPKTFVNSPKYLNANNALFPVVMGEFIELNSGDYYEAVLTGAIGIGKTTIAIYTLVYQLYKLSLLKNPQKKFGLDPSSEIVFIIQSVSHHLAKNVDYLRVRELIDKSEYFKNYFPYGSAKTTELNFPNNICIQPVPGTALAALGQNVFGGIIDEMNFMAVIEKRKISKTAKNTIKRSKATMLSAGEENQDL